MTGFVFHKSYWDAISNLPDEVSKCKVIEAMCNYVFSNIEPELSGIEKSIWSLMRPTLDSSTKRYKSSVENGKKGGRPKKTQEKPNNNLTKTQDKSQVKPNQNLNKDKDKDKDIDKDIDKDKDKDNALSMSQELKWQWQEKKEKKELTDMNVLLDNSHLLNEYIK